MTGFLCRDYLSYNWFLSTIDFLVPWIIVQLNNWLMAITTWCVKWIKYETKSLELSKIQTIVFFMTFFNSGLAILLINANFTGENNL